MFRLGKQMSKHMQHILMHVTMFNVSIYSTKRSWAPRIPVVSGCRNHGGLSANTNDAVHFMFLIMTSQQTTRSKRAIDKQ